ncbi:MAG: hypothetical protein ACXADO_00725 [Candidatus Thorarchaeota archaeon]|jgi:hypothetical protein
MNAIVEFAQGGWGTLILALSIIGLFMAYLLKMPKSTTTRGTVKTLSIVGVGFVLLVGYAAPMVWGPPGPITFVDSYEVQMTEDNTAASWADYLGTADADLWAAAEGDCNNALHQCTVLVTATRVGTGINTMAPDESLQAFKITRNSNNPDVPDDEDFAAPNVRLSYAHASWTNSTSGDTFDAIYKDANANYIVYIEQGVTAGGEGLASGETKTLDIMQPGDSLTYYIGIKYNPVGFGADGQTAGVSSITLTGEIAGYSFTLDLNVVSIA